RAHEDLEVAEAVVAEPGVVEDEAGVLDDGGVVLGVDLEGDAVEEPALEAEARAAKAEAGLVGRVARLHGRVRAEVRDGLHLQEHLGLDGERAGVEAEVVLEGWAAL